jgi:hypothetical protein
MRLSAQVITVYCNINMFTYGTEWIIRAGDPNTLYFQIVDLDQTTLANISGSSTLLYGGPFNIPAGLGQIAGLRHLLGIGTSNQPYGVRVTFPSSNSRKAVCLIATQADPNDSSIWQVVIPPNLQPFSGNVLFQVTEGQNIRRFSVLNMISVQSQNDGQC